MLCHTARCKSSVVCNDCLAYFPKLKFACTTCAIPLSEPHFLHCGKCIIQKPAIDNVITHYRFQEPLRMILHQFKYHEGFYLTSLITQLMIEALPVNYQTQCIIPVPMHLKRLQERGFNHALHLAKPLARYLNAPLETRICKKVIHTPSQASLKAHTRKHNLRHAYSIQKTHHQHVTLVDDLITTGNTANEIAKALKKTGVKRVDLWCCAKTCF